MNYSSGQLPISQWPRSDSSRQVLTKCYGCGSSQSLDSMNARVLEAPAEMRVVHHRKVSAVEVLLRANRLPWYQGIRSVNSWRSPSAHLSPCRAKAAWVTLVFSLLARICARRFSICATHGNPDQKSSVRTARASPILSPVADTRATNTA